MNGPQKLKRPLKIYNQKIPFSTRKYTTTPARNRTLSNQMILTWRVFSSSVMPHLRRLFDSHLSLLARPITVKIIPIMKNIPYTQNVWAPEFVFDPHDKLYYIFWSSTVRDQKDTQKSKLMKYFRKLNLKKSTGYLMMLINT